MYEHVFLIILFSFKEITKVGPSLTLRLIRFHKKILEQQNVVSDVYVITLLYAIK